MWQRGADARKGHLALTDLDPTQGEGWVEVGIWDLMGELELMRLEEFWVFQGLRRDVFWSGSHILYDHGWCWG